MSEDLEWLASLIVYQIYPRSFKDSNGDGIGDLIGIKEKLDYLVDLGINTVWLSPIYKSPMADFGYDISDYKDIDPIFGSLKDFDGLLKACHNKGIKLLMDFVPNHTSSQHPWFMESRSSINNPKRDWYIWKEGKSDESLPNNWLSTFGGSAWELDKTTNQYYLHSFDKEQPDLNWRNPEVVKEMLDVLRFWLDRGVDGFRVDVPEWIFKDDKFENEPENPSFLAGMGDPYNRLIHQYTVGLPESIQMIKKFVEVLEEYDEKFMVTEIWSPIDKLLKIYSVVERKFLTPFNFALITLPWLANEHKNFIDKYDEGVGGLYFPNYVLGSHDNWMVVTRIGKDQAKIGAMLQFSLRGIPFVYYGEEIGMEDTEIPEDKIQDPFEKKSPGLKLGRDPERTPMQWDNSRNAGFGKGEPWLPVNKNFTEVNVASERVAEDSMLNFYKKLISLRKNLKAIIFGKYMSWDVEEEQVFAFIRHFKKETLLTLLNYSDEEKKISLPFTPGKILISTHKRKNIKQNLSEIVIQPNEGLIISLV